MSLVSFNVRQIKQARPENVEKSLIGFGKDIEKSLTGASSPFGCGALGGLEQRGNSDNT
jgi:hypothetical protein